MRKIIIILVIIVSLLVVFSMHNAASNSDKNKAEDKTSIEVVTLKRSPQEKTIRLPGDLLPYEAVDVFAKVSGFIEKINVDRGSIVKKGDILSQLVVPELDKQIVAAQAQYTADDDLYRRYKTLKNGEVPQASVEAAKDAAKSAYANMQALQEQKNYLTIRAPFDGTITTRNLHTGAFVIAGGNNGAVPLFHMETIDMLRLVVAVPEAQTESVRHGTEVSFAVPALPDKKFTAKVARISHLLDQGTRTEPVELDVKNSEHTLNPGMYADVNWPVTHSGDGFLVPAKAIVTTTERTFVIRIKDGVAEWVDIKRGNAFGDNVEVFGNLQEGDTIAARATDELREGTKVDIKSGN